MTITFLILFLLLSSPSSPNSRLVAATRPLGSSFKDDFVSLIPRPIGLPGPTTRYTGKELDDCLPKRFRRNSAPSRYINYHTLDETLCTNDRRIAPSTP
ncbi:hypothetical protein BVRB_9g216510 [Beta vulgaris subsp. vulgaris]|nr:hypothetical protein BVRB_9g216510 [Beta vulgaris subsp. vulgaris]